MNILEIKNLIIKIGEFDVKIDDQKSRYLLNGKDMISFNQIDIQAFKNEFSEKLKKQLYNKSDVTMLLGLNDDVLIQLKNLKEIYRIYRIKLAKSQDEEISKVYLQVCQIIIAKINLLDEIQNEIIPIINNFDYKLDSDFSISISQTTEIEFEDNELELSGVPKLNLSNRFKLLKTLKIVDVLEELKIDKKQKTILLALTMGINIDNARHLLSNTYPDPPKSKERELENFFIKYKINL